MAIFRRSLTKYVKRHLIRGHMVIITGGPCSGKSWTLHQLFGDEVINTKRLLTSNRNDSYPHKGGEIHYNALAIDEAQMLPKNISETLTDILVSNDRGVLIASQNLKNVPHSVITNYQVKNKDIIIIQLQRFNSDSARQPDWCSYQLK